MRLVQQLTAARPGSLQSYLEIIDDEEQEKPVPRFQVRGTDQGRMFMVAPFVETKEHGSIGIEDLPKLSWAGADF